MDEGRLVYEYNMMIVERYIAGCASKRPPDKRRIEVIAQLESPKALAKRLIRSLLTSR